MKRILLSLSLFIVASFGLFMVSSARILAANPGAQKACETLEGLDVECNSNATTNDIIGGPISSLMSLLSIVVGAASVAMLVYGGFKIITSGGESEKVNSGRKTIIYALVGLAVAVMAQVLVKFVFNKAQNL